MTRLWRHQGHAHSPGTDPIEDPANIEKTALAKQRTSTDVMAYVRRCSPEIGRCWKLGSGVILVFGKEAAGMVERRQQAAGSRRRSRWKR
jgi:tRNA C32,U32 (ribose-2'-O)-methylase TrmJ